MNKPKPLLAATSRVLLNTLAVLAMVVIASLIGVGGAAVWIYGRTDLFSTAAKSPALRAKAVVAMDEAHTLPQLTPVQTEDDEPAQLTPAHYLPSEGEIAAFAGTPRYTYVSYNGGRQQAHLLVNTVLSTSVPAPLPAVPVDDTAMAQVNDRPPLTDAASYYITDAQGRVIGIDGSAGAAAETDAQQQVPVVRALPVQVAATPEVRVAAPVTEYGQHVYDGGHVSSAAATNYLPIRKALPVGEEDAADTAAPTSFDARAELAREDEHPAYRTQPVARSARPARSSMFGASDSFRAFGQE